MSENLEFTGDTIEEAIQRGCDALGVKPGDFIVEVLEEPHRGVFGIGARPARIRLKLLRPPTPAAPPAPKPVDAPRRDEDTREDSRRDDSRRESGPRRDDSRRDDSRRDDSRRDDSRRDSSRGGDRRGGQRGDRRDGGRSGDRRGGPRGDRREGGRSGGWDGGRDDRFETSDEPAYIGLPDSELDDEALVAREVLIELLEHLNMRNAKVVVSRAEPGDTGEKAPWMLNVEGNYAHNLVGKRGETLSSLQYVLRLICSRRLQRRANIVLDAGGYKSKRSQRLRDLAIRMADQAVSTARTITLEPMPPHERRMIHMTLRAREDVTTKSTGEGSSRKVMIVPK